MSKNHGEEQLNDPDPFSIAFALANLVFSACAFLEARHRSRTLEAQDQNRFRMRWHQAKALLYRARQVINRFEIAAEIHGYRNRPFRFGESRLFVDRYEKRQFRGMLQEANTIGTQLSLRMDDLSEFIGQEHQDTIGEIWRNLYDLPSAQSFETVLLLTNRAIDAFDDLLAGIEQDWQS